MNLNCLEEPCEPNQAFERVIEGLNPLFSKTLGDEAVHHTPVFLGRDVKRWARTARQDKIGASDAKSQRRSCSIPS